LGMTPEERQVLQQVMQVLGPEAVCACGGCAWETNEAIRLLKTIGIQYQLREKKPRQPHNVEAERRGNETER
jgi:shikimate kinase